jgi:hypothetical protein
MYRRRPVPAKGVSAIGQFAYGVVTISQFGLGVLSVSQFTIAGKLDPADCYRSKKLDPRRQFTGRTEDRSDLSIVESCRRFHGEGIRCRAVQTGK